jgi:SAM-dependent methyltransferase
MYVKDIQGSCLELGAAPYFMTMLLEKFSSLKLTVANYYGPEYRQDKFAESISYTDPYSQMENNIGLQVFHFNVEDGLFPFDENAFDVVLFCEIIEHLIHDPIKVLKEIKRVLKKGGILIITTPNVARLENIAKLAAGGNIYDPYSGYGPYGRHSREYTVQEMELILDFCGFDIESMFTVDTIENVAYHYAPIERLRSIIENRSADLGQTIFIRALNKRAAKERRPTFLYRSYPDSEMETGPIHLTQEADIVGGSICGLNGEWYAPEDWGGITTRWMAAEGTLLFQSKKRRTSEISFRIMSFHRQRVLNISVNGQKIWHETVPINFVKKEFKIVLNAGITPVKFETPDGSERPCDIPGFISNDNRRLSFAFQDIKIK